MEFRRRQGFKRIFPSVNYALYKQFFIAERPLNNLVDERVMAKRRQTLKLRNKARVD